MNARCHHLPLPPTHAERWYFFLLLWSLLTLLSARPALAQDQFEAESTNRANVSVATTHAGYTGSGYVTGITSEWSYLSFDKSNSNTQPARLDIRYANGTGSSVTNLGLYVGSQLVQTLTFPTTNSWTDWQTLSANITLPAGYIGIRIDGLSNANSSVNIDAFTLTLGATAPPTPPGSFALSSPANGITDVATQPTFSWQAASGADTYALVVSTSSNYSSPVIDKSNLSGTSYTPGSALSEDTKYYWKVTATNAQGSTSANAGRSFTTTDGITPPPPPPVAGTVYEAESLNRGNVSVASQYGGYSGNGYVTGFTSEWSKVSLERSYNNDTPVQVNIRYANGTGGTVTNLALYQGSQKITDLAFPATSGWTQWGVVSATLTVPAGYQGISVEGERNVSQSVNIDYLELVTNGVTVPPGSFSQSAPVAGATGVAALPTFTWGTSSSADSYTLRVSENSNLSSPVISKSGISGTSYAPSTPLSNSTKYYWKVTATNGSGTTTASNAGRSFTTAAEDTPPPTTDPPTTAEPGVIREVYNGIAGSTVNDLLSSPDFPGSPSAVSVLGEFNAPNDVGENYGQRLRGYLKPTSSGSYQFSIAADDDAELWLSTDASPGNKVRIAYVNGWTNYLQYDKFGSQTSASIALEAGQFYYIEALHKEKDGGDHLTVAWKGPGVSHQIISSANLVTAPPTPPSDFTLKAPANNAEDVSLTPKFEWNASTGVGSYELVVSENQDYSSPAIKRGGLSGTSFTPGGGLQGTTTYYWKVTATNEAGAVVASNAGRSFTTLTPPAPSAFTQTAPAKDATAVSRTPTFTWATSANASSYTLVVSKNSNLSSPVVSENNITSASFTPSASLAANTKYYWRVTAKNSTGTKVATNATLAFTTSDITGTYYYVATNGQDAPNRGSQGSPFKTIAYAAQQVPEGPDVTIFVNPGTYAETQPIELPLGVNLEGAGESKVTITASGELPVPAGVDRTSNDWKLWYYGSLIQLYSAGYSGGPEQIYGSPDQMVPSSDGNQTLSGFTVEGQKQVKAGVWVQNRNNVTMHNVTINNCKQRGAVFTRSDMWWYEPLPDGMWMHNTKVYNCTFNENGAQLGSETLGNLCLAGLDGADIYNITIKDEVGYGIKFIMVGHYRNVRIHDCDITVNEADAQWGEKISIELWNLDQGNEVYNIVCNTWHSYVNHGQLTSYEPSGTSTNNLKIHNVVMIDSDGSSSKEAIEAALSGVEIYDCYIQDKGFGIAIWNGAGQTLKKNYRIHHNIITNVKRTPNFGFGKSSAVFVPDAAQNIKIYNNVFDRMGNGLNLDAALSADVKNNVFLNTVGADVENGSGITFKNNLKFHTEANKNQWNLVGGTSLDGGNKVANPGFRNSGDRQTNYYRPASSASAVVDAGIDVGLPYLGAAPDMGRFEFGSNARTAAVGFEKNALKEDVPGVLRYYPNPTTGRVTLETGSPIQLTDVRVYNRQGQLLQPTVIERDATLQIDLGNYPDDLYFLMVNHAEGQIVKKVMLSR